MADRTQKLTRRQQRLAEKENFRKERCHTINTSLKIQPVRPMTNNQQIMFDRYEQGDHLFVLGAPGAGKSFLSMYLALREIEDKRSLVNKLVIIRSAQPSKQIGFLKGDEKQKVAVYELPYKNICSKLYGRADAYDILKNKGVIEFQSTSFLRGNEYDNAVMFLDEGQNLTFQELFTTLTRVGDNTKVIVAGDTNQDDLTSKRYNEESGLPSIIMTLERVSSMSKVVFTSDDIVRSGFVKELLIARMELNL